MSTSTDTTTTAPTLDDYASHSAFSDPGAHAAALASVPTDPASLHAFVTGAVVHYYAGTPTLTHEQMADIDLRWVEKILETAFAREPGIPLEAPRPQASRLGGCCRDHSLLAVAVLREHGIPARTRLGFADYLGEAGFHHDHVIVERHDGDRWVRFDPELANADHPFDSHDIPAGTGFATAAEIWLAHRSGHLDVDRYGARPGDPLLTGAAFVHRYVLADLAHRQRCELLLWDVWGAMTALGAEPDRAAIALTDEVAALTVRADGGDADAAAALAHLWTDDRLRPARYVATWSPVRRLGWTDLVARSTSWAQIPVQPNPGH